MLKINEKVGKDLIWQQNQLMIGANVTRITFFRFFKPTKVIFVIYSLKILFWFIHLNCWCTRGFQTRLLMVLDLYFTGLMIIWNIIAIYCEKLIFCCLYLNDKNKFQKYEKKDKNQPQYILIIGLWLIDMLLVVQGFN